MRRMSAGSGYQYLLRSVAAGDGNRVPVDAAHPLLLRGRYAAGPLARVRRRRLRCRPDSGPGMQVTEEQLALLIGMGRDPITGEQLGRAYPSYKRLADRIEERVAALDPGDDPGGLRGRDDADRG